MDDRFEMVEGYMWPKSDRDCRAVVFRTAQDMDPAIEQCLQHRTVVQAGGNCGVWPNYLSSRFDNVITFEPDPDNFECLAHNVAPKLNVECFNVALGERAGTADMVRSPRNIGAHYLTEEMQRGEVQIRVFDQMMMLPNLDYICLDIEGHEMPALKGMRHHIDMFRPVIQIEDKGLSERYGYKKGDTEKWLAKEFGYAVSHRIARDVILVCL